MSFHFNIDKAVQAVSVLLALSPSKSMNYMKLIKLLYIADRESIKETGTPITGDRYVAMKHGPVLSSIYDLILGREWQPGFSTWARYIKTDLKAITLEQDPGVECLSEYEVKKLKEVFEEYQDKTQWELRDLTHDFEEWKRNDPGASSKNISLPHVLEAVGRKDDIDDILQDAEDSEYFAKLFGDSKSI